MKVALYARVSRVGKDIKQDPEVQLRDLREWCVQHKHEIVGEYADRGVSGIKSSRPQLNRLMSDAKREQFEAVVVWRLDRFGRSLQHLQNAVTELHDAGVKFISLRDGFDLTTAVGKVIFAVLGAIAEFERNLIAERIAAGLRAARAKGHRPGRKIDPQRGPSRTTLWRQAKGVSRALPIT